MFGQTTDRICGSCFFTEDLVPWTQQELSKLHAKAATAGTPTPQRRSKTKSPTLLENLPPLL